MTIAKTALLGVLALPLLGACNTVDGVGRDVQAIGSGVSTAANYVEREVFGVSPQPVRQARVVRRETVSVGRACDPGGELAGGTGLPPCRERITITPANRSPR